MDKEIIPYNYRAGYVNAQDNIDVPDGSIIAPSSNVIYNRRGKPVSLKSLTLVGSSENKGGSRAFTLDKNLVGLMGNNMTSERAIGNMLQGVGRSLWFVGNTLTYTFTFPSSDVDAVGNTITETSHGMVNGAKIRFNSTTGALPTATPALTLNTWYYVVGITANTFQIALTSGGAAIDFTAAGSGTTAAEVADDSILNPVRVMSNFGTPSGIGNLSSIPQYARYNGSGWNAPVQVGLAEQTETAELILTTASTRDALFSGIVTGSTSLRIARKRNGSVSIASGASNIVTGDSDSMYATIPDYPEDGSLQADRSWLLYFTPTGFGSQAAHLLFPIEIPESKLDGTDATGWSDTQGNAKVKVISQHASDQSQRKIEIEFNTNDLLNILPFDDYYPAEACRFVAQLGNVMCLVGTGVDSTGFDVSFPNNREAFSPDWRDWFAEVPVSIAHNTDAGIFWVMTANRTYQARWTGATQQSAPVVLTEVTSMAGAIGEGASTCVNGILYFLSSGGTPVRINQDRQIDGQFGSRVRNAFSSFDSTTQTGYDEDTNSVVFISGNSALAYQIDTDKWSSVLVPNDGTAYGTTACFSINGHLYLCSFNEAPTPDTFQTNSWNSGSGNNTWRAVSVFKGGESGIYLKDIIEARVIMEAATQPYAITFKAHKNFITSSPATLFTANGSVTNELITTRVYVESLDYDVISLEATGTKGGQTVHAAFLHTDIHQIERGT